MIEAEKLFNELEKRGLEWADTDAAFRVLEDVRHTILSEAIADLKSKDSMAAQKTRAETSHKYTEYLVKLGEARRLSNRAKVRWLSFQAYLDLMRSKSAARNSEMNLR